MTITAKRSPWTSRFLIHHLYQCLDVSKAISKPLLLAGVSVDLRHMIGHQHPVVSNFFVGADGADKIYVAVVRESLLKIQEAAFDVPEMHIENFPARPKMTDNVEDLFTGVLKTFGDRPLAEIQPMIGARAQLNEFLKALHTSQHAMDPTKSLGFRHRWVVGMACQPYLVLLRNRYHALQEIRNAVPRFFGRHRAGLRQFAAVCRLFVVEPGVSRSASARRGSCPHHTQDGQVVGKHWKARPGGVADFPAENVDFPVALRALAHHDVRDL